MVAFMLYNLLHDEAEFWYRELGQSKEQFYCEALLMHVRKCINENPAEKGYRMVDYIERKRASRGEVPLDREV